MSTHPLFIRLVLGFVLTSMITGCANFRDKYKIKKTWDKSETDTRRKGEKEFSLFLIGDTGLADSTHLNPGLKAMRAIGAQSQNESAVVVLGDNIYPKGLPPLNHPERGTAELALSTMVSEMSAFTPHFWFVPGNHDWQYGLEGLKRQEQFLKNQVGRKVLLPEAGCGDPVVELLNDNIVIIFIDTEWYIRNWDNDLKINEGCEIKSRSEFFLKLGGELDKHIDKHVVLCFHHPLWSYGPHGGRYRIKDHVFPFSAADKKALIPLPIVGSLMTWMRFNIGIPQDIHFKPYVDFRQRLLNLTSEHKNIVYASGHEHTLQYLNHKDHSIVVSGSGSKRSPQSLGDKALFTSSKSGFAKIDYFKNGASEISYFSYDDKADQTIMLFRKELKGPSFGYQSDTSYVVNTKVQRNVKLFEGTKRRGKLYRWMWGGLNRFYYNQGITVPVLNLADADLIPESRGAGDQTKSLRLEGEDENKFILKTIDRDASRIFYGMFNGTIVEDIFQDYFTAAHPYSPLAIPPMARALGLYHTRPKLVFLPRQNELGLFNPKFGDRYYLLEERPEDDWRHAENFGNSKEIVGSDQVFKDISRDSKYKIDQHFTARNRVFDMILGDWDRHEEQWRWSKVLTDSVTYYRPIPRNRNQALSHYDGWFTQLVKLTSPIARQLQPFSKEVKNAKWLNHNGFHFDLAYLNELDWNDWQDAIQHVQENLTGEAIDKGLLSMPVGVRLRSHDDLGPIIKSRRDNIRNTVKHYYSILAREVDVPGTEKDDIFIIHYPEKDAVEIRIYTIENYPLKAHYQRTFTKDVTKYVQLYGRDGNDQFILTGHYQGAPGIRIVGGLKADQLQDRLDKGSSSPNIEIFDYPEGLSIQSGRSFKDYRSRNWELNHYDHLERKYDRSMLIPLVNFETGVGLSTSLIYKYKDYGFKRNPLQSEHEFRVSYGFLSQGYQIAYKGKSIHKGSRWFSEFSGLLSKPQFNFNFYGRTNEFFNTDQEQSFFRAQLEGFEGKYKLNRNWKSGFRWNAGIGLESKKLNRLSGANSTDELNEVLFKHQPHINLSTGVKYNSYPDKILPTHGLDFSFNLGYLYTILEDGFNTPYLETHLEMYQKLFSTNRVILKLNFDYKVLWDEFFIYNAASLGGGNSLRGFFDQRFAGYASLSNSNDLNLYLFDWDTALLPLKVGARGLFDYGRVWARNERSTTWHHSYGGGIYFSSLDAVMISADIHFSEGGSPFLFGFNIDL